MNLVLLVCLISSPQDCREEQVAVSYELTDPRACMMGAVPVIAEWTDRNPDLHVTRWKCSGASASQITRNFN